MLLEGLRVDSLWLLHFRVSQFLSGILFFVFLIIYIAKLKENYKIENNSEQ